MRPPSPLEEGQLTQVRADAMRPVRRVAMVARGEVLTHRAVMAQHGPTHRDATRRDHAAVGFVTGSARSDGVSVGLLGSAYREVRGGPLGGLAGVSEGPVRGVPLASAVNAGGDVDGVQLALVNRADSLDGVSIGLVNSARTGTGLPLGVVNVVADGLVEVEAWSSDLSLANAGLKSGKRLGYSEVAVGGDPLDEAGMTSLGGGFGRRLVWRGPRTVDVDLFTMAHFPRAFHGATVVTTPSLRGQVRLDLHEHFGLFAGVSLGGQVSMQDPDLEVTHRPTLDVPVSGGEGVVGLYPGWFAGVRF